MCVSASMRVYESLELPSRQLCVWKSRETGNQLHVAWIASPLSVLSSPFLSSTPPFAETARVLANWQPVRAVSL